MQLTLKDKRFLKSCGYIESDFKYIACAAKKCKITILTDDFQVRIRHIDFIKIFGRDRFLNRLARAIFHKSSFYYDKSDETGYLFEI
ncbi:MAG: hypothetical protein IJ529_02275 [Alphaproteobacteria bacterium]|nr:hypothetical protein [Alphaproteobacteria bacterium]MBR1599962.1 hypothetical protein [Alphaproteobacteria bacterium]